MRYAATFGLFFLSAIGSACAAREVSPTGALPPKGGREEAALRARVMDWWAARAQRIQRTMWELYEPAYREKVGLMEFSIEGTTRDRFDLTDATIREVVFEAPDRASVQVDFNIRTPQFSDPIPTGARETWVKVRGKWYKRHVAPTTPVQPPGGGPAPG